MAKIQKCCILWCFFPFRCENFCFEKRSKHRNLQCFLLPPKTKQRYLRCFPSLATPKQSRNSGIYDVFATSKKTSVAKTPLFAWLLQHHICKMLYFTVFFFPLFKTLVFTVFWKITCIKPCKYQQILTFASSFATSQQMLKHWYLQRFWTMIVAKKCYFWSVFPQLSCGHYPPNPSKFPKPHFLLTCTYFRGRRHGPCRRPL